MKTNCIDKENLKKLEKSLGKYRYKHSLSVMKEAEKLCKLYDCDVEKGKIAGLLHDCAKFKNKDKAYEYIEKYNLKIKNEYLDNPSLLHPELGYYIAKIEYNIEDEEIRNAIRFHTTLRENPTTLEKIIYIADGIEPNRKYEGVEKLRKLTYKNLDKGVLYSLEKTIVDLIKKGKHIAIRSVKARNYLLDHINNNK